MCTDSWYVYTPLDFDRDAIRLVRLLSGTDGPIRLELFQSYLHDESCIPYDALSHIWGYGNTRHTVYVDGKPITVMSDLHLALLSLRSEHVDRVLWVDAICIDQSNILEKNHQVQQVGTIYGRAEQVIFWLGESTPETDVVFHSMQRLHEEEVKNRSYRNWKLSNKRLSELWSTVGNADEDLVLQNRKGLENILSRPWFRRVWIIQEVVNARSAKVACGLETVTASVFVVTPSLVGVTPDLHCQAVLDLMPGRGRKNSWWTKDPDFSTILLKFKGGQASDPRDMIYALLGLCRDEHTQALHPDYTKSLAEVIQDTVAALLRIDDGMKSTCLFPEWDLSEFYKNLPSLVDTVSRWAIKEGQTTTLETIMRRNNVHVVGDSFGPESLLWEPIVHLDTAIVQLLFELGADVDFCNEESCDALVAAVRNGHRQTVKLLLERFTKVDRSGDDYNNILRHADLRELLPETGVNSDVLGGKSIDGSQVTSADDNTSSIKNSHTYVNSTNGREEYDGITEVNLEESIQARDTWAQRKRFEDVDVRSLVSEEDDAASSTSMPLPSWASETEHTIVGVFAHSSVLSPLYSRALQLMSQERFINNFRRLLREFHGNLLASDDSIVTHQLAKLLKSKRRQGRIARRIMVRHVALQGSWDEEDLAGIRDQEKQAYTNIENWLDRTIVSSAVTDAPAAQSANTSDGFESDDDSGLESDGEQNISHFAQYPRLDLVVQKLVEGQPFQDMLASFKVLLLPPGLLKELLPIPRDKITYVTTKEVGFLSKVQGFLEGITALEWDWWPLPPRMRPLKSTETRVHWQCFCGIHRWRELRLEQQEILEEVLKESSADHHSRPLCALLRDAKSAPYMTTSSPSGDQRERRGSLAVLNCSLICMAAAFGWSYRGLPVGWRWCCLTIACFVWVVGSQNPASQPKRTVPSGAHSAAPSRGAAPSLGTQAMQSQPGSSATSQAGGNVPIQPTPVSSLTTQSSLVNNSAYNKQLWVNFGVDGSWTSTELDQIGGLHLVSDSAFLRKLGKRHREIRGWFLHYFSFRIMSYWEFLRFKRLPLRPPPQTIDVEADLPTSSDYEYDPRPPNATLDKPGISKHEFEVYVRLCLDSCWLSSLPILHTCRTVEDSAVNMIDKIPRYKKSLKQLAQGDEHVWGIRARYVASGVRVIALHVAILCISFGVWIWWQWKHPDDLQGAAVALTTAFLLVSTFWSATGVLKDLR